MMAGDPPESPSGGHPAAIEQLHEERAMVLFDLVVLFLLSLTTIEEM